MKGKTGKIAILPGLGNLKNRTRYHGSDGMLAMWPPLRRSCLPKIYGSGTGDTHICKLSHFG